MSVRESQSAGSRQPDAQQDAWFPMGDYRRGRDIFPLIPPIHRQRPAWPYILVGALGVLVFFVAVIGSSMSSRLVFSDQVPCPPHVLRGSWCLVSQSQGSGR